MASKFGYRLTKRAESDLDGIVSYIAIDLANLQAASDFVDKLLYNIEEARVFPENGSLVDNEFLVRKCEKEIDWKLYHVLSSEYCREYNLNPTYCIW